MSNPFKGLGVLIALIVVPLILIIGFVFTRPKLKELPFYGDMQNTQDSTYYQINDFSFIDASNKTINRDSLKGRITVVNTVLPSCPTSCPIIVPFLKELVYDKVHTSTVYSDVLIMSYLEDSSGGEVDLNQFTLEQEGIASNKWKFVTGQDNSLYDFTLEETGFNLKYDNPEGSHYGGKAYYSVLLLIDKNLNVRGIYQGNKSDEYLRLFKEIRVLIKLQETGTPTATKWIFRVAILALVVIILMMIVGYLQKKKKIQQSPN